MTFWNILIFILLICFPYFFIDLMHIKVYTEKCLPYIFLTNVIFLFNKIDPLLIVHFLNMFCQLILRLFITFSCNQYASICNITNSKIKAWINLKDSHININMKKLSIFVNIRRKFNIDRVSLFVSKDEISKNI